MASQATRRLSGFVRSLCTYRVSSQNGPSVASSKCNLPLEHDGVKVSDINSRLTTMHLTSAYLSGMTNLKDLEMSLPSVLPRTIPYECPQNEDKNVNILVPGQNLFIRNAMVF